MYSLNNQGVVIKWVVGYKPIAIETLVISSELKAAKDRALGCLVDSQALKPNMVVCLFLVVL